MFRRWFGASRFVFNKTVEYLKQPGTKANWMEIKLWLLKELPDWAQEIPFQIKGTAIRDACLAVKAAKTKFKQTGKPQHVDFRSRKDPDQTIFIPQTAVRKGSVYRTLTGDLHSSELIENVEHDCRLLRQSGRYFLTIPQEREILVPENQRAGIVALDPGVRSFLTFYSETETGKIGEKDFGNIVRLCHYLDQLMSKISKAKGEQKRRMKKASERIRWRIKDLVSEIHHKAATWLCKSFDVVVIPPFETSQMVSKLRSKTARAMLTWAHFRFRQILDNTAEIFSTQVVEQNEAYTSKTCSACGQVHNIGSKKTMVCSCGLTMDRDINGARGIFLRALGDSPLLKSHLQYAFVDES
ncbi:MAG: transposase [Magnetococcus sp. YQC-5]